MTPAAAVDERPLELDLALDAEKSASLSGSVYFRGERVGDEQPAVRNIYLARDAWGGMGEPVRLRLSLAKGAVE